MATAEILIKGRDEYSRLTDKAKRDVVELGRVTKQSMAQAKDSADILKDTFGIGIPRELTKLLAQSKLIGPALAGAFSAVAAIGFIGVLGQIPEMFSKIEAATTGWDDAAKKAYSDFLTENQKAIDSAEKFRLKLVEIEKGTTAAIKAQIKDLAAATAELQRAAIGAAQPGKSSLTDMAIKDATFGLFDPAKKRAEAEAKRLQDLANKSGDQLRAAQSALIVEAATESKKASEQHVKDVQAQGKKIRDILIHNQEDLTRELAEASRIGNTAMDRASKEYIDLLNARIEAAKDKIKDLDFWEQQLFDFRNRTFGGGESVKAGEETADAIAKGIIDNAKKMKDEYRAAFESVKQTANRAFLDIFAAGKGVFSNLAGVIKGIFRTIAAEILSTLTAELFTPLIKQLSGLLTTGLGKIPGLGGVFGAGAGAAGGAAGGGISGASAAAFATNPFTIAGAAAIAGAVAWIKSQAHHEANTFVQNFQNPFGSALSEIVDSFNAAKAAGTLSTGSANSAFNRVQDIFREFTQNAAEFAAHGSDEALVVQQAHQTLDPLIEQILTDMKAAIETIPGVKTPGKPPQPLTIMFQLDRKTVGRLILADINDMIRNEGAILLAAR